MRDCIVIIPTYNEKENVTAIIHAVLSRSPRFDVLIIDDGSPDGTADIVKGLQAADERIHLIERKGKLGLGTAYITGFRWSLDRNYAYIFEMDADFSHNPDDLQRLLEACSIQGADMSVGSRYVKHGKVVNWPKDRILMSYFASIYVRLVTWMPVKDTTGGFVCYKREVLERINIDRIKFVGYAFQIEMKYRTYCKKFDIAEVPIIFTDRTKGVSKMSNSIIIEAVFGVISLRLRQLIGRL